MKVKWINLLLAIIITIILMISQNFLNIKSNMGNIFKGKKRFVFIDLGANTGDSIKYFIDKNESPESQKIDQYLKGYGARTDTRWEIYCVEANPYFNKSLEELKNYCESLGHKFYLYAQSAAWIKNEKLTFYLDTVNKGHNYWGSSLLENHPDVISSNKTKTIVNGIDVADLLRKYKEDDEIVLKIDIEGTEYKLLKHLIEQEVLKLVDIIAIEFHERFLDIKDVKALRTEFNNYFTTHNIKSVPWY